MKLWKTKLSIILLSLICCIACTNKQYQLDIEYKVYRPTEVNFFKKSVNIRASDGVFYDIYCTRGTNTLLVGGQAFGDRIVLYQGSNDVEVIEFNYEQIK